MTDAKRTKRQRADAEHLSLEEHIAQRRDELLRSREEAPELRREAETMRQQADALTRRWQVRTRRDLLASADELDREADVRESMTREYAFETTIVTYLRAYHQMPSHTSSAVTTACRTSDTIEAYVRHTDQLSQRQASILDEYLTEMNKAPRKVAMARATSARGARTRPSCCCAAAARSSRAPSAATRSPTWTRRRRRRTSTR